MPHMSSKSIRVSDALFEKAQASAEVHSRSIAQQVEHWARLGAALEASNPGARDIEKLLTRKTSELPTARGAQP